ncbi:Acetyltransferase (GNAT) domain-containing protein [Paenibacillus sp. 1_12]|uniref:GNAT family N-acetyltransferase n=1 Tax=Paenibacillus sp. 1_12 TaxID=1566278 RepID=UPI0008EE69D7|nr:GNAT family N-acetyltransferase [Paenibacillus sp. 1_12]SFK93485.1 Acetyltransferase (GNAT) domain-containing protein [Paenibacillus sp. 1_12]
MHIRIAATSDASQIAELSNQLGYVASEDQIIERLIKLLKDDDNAIFVMEIDGMVAGWAHVHGRHLIESPDFAEIGGLVVHHQHRRKGIGEQLMRSCEEWAKQKEYNVVRVRSGGHRVEAHQFYERIGYSKVKSQEVFNLDLQRSGLSKDNG